jgi:hypothetical protein
MGQTAGRTMPPKASRSARSSAQGSSAGSGGRAGTWCGTERGVVLLGEAADRDEGGPKATDGGQGPSG